MERKLKDTLKYKAEEQEFSSEFDIQKSPVRQNSFSMMKKWPATIATAVVILIGFIFVLSYGENGDFTQPADQHIKDHEWVSVNYEEEELEEIKNNDQYFSKQDAALTFISERFDLPKVKEAFILEKNNETSVEISFEDIDLKIRTKLTELIEHKVWYVNSYKVNDAEHFSKFSAPISKKEAKSIAEQIESEIRTDGRYDKIDFWANAELRNFIDHDMNQPRKHWHLTAVTDHPKTNYVTFGIDAKTGERIYGKSSSVSPFIDQIIEVDNSGVSSFSWSSDIVFSIENHEDLIISLEDSSIIFSSLSNAEIIKDRENLDGIKATMEIHEGSNPSFDVLIKPEENQIIAWDNEFNSPFLLTGLEEIFEKYDFPPKQ